MDLNQPTCRRMLQMPATGVTDQLQHRPIPPKLTDMLTTSRREFLAQAASVTVVARAMTGTATAEDQRPAPSPSEPGPLVISTWPFGKPSNEMTLKVLKDGGSPLDAVEQGIRLTESDLGNPSVGLGGIPNSEGIVQLDACIMSGPGHRAGSVAAVTGFQHPISIARRVMETTRHVMLVGEGAMRFASQHGFEKGPEVTEGQREAWKKWKAEQPKPAVGGARPPAPNHDTLALLLLAPDGNIYGGCSTSGWGYKLPGRVGDSPIIGGGLYVDNEVGAAGATGIGENVMRYCGSFLIVELMRQGRHPQDACIEAIQRIARLDPKGFDLSINFIALDKQGRYGAAGTGTGFQYSVAGSQFSRVEQSPGLTAAPIGPVGGNQGK
jgi:isoaspartyl peptidase/L-asparaginase-like protein (Ntn-hydrolase superfamily)